MNLDRIVADALGAVPLPPQHPALIISPASDPANFPAHDLVVTADLVEHAPPAQHLAACAALVADGGYLVVVAGDAAPHGIDGGPLPGGASFYAVSTDSLIAALGPGWAVTWRHPTHPALVAQRAADVPPEAAAAAQAAPKTRRRR